MTKIDPVSICQRVQEILRRSIYTIHTEIQYFKYNMYVYVCMNVCMCVYAQGGPTNEQALFKNVLPVFSFKTVYFPYDLEFKRSSN